MSMGFTNLFMAETMIIHISQRYWDAQALSVPPKRIISILFTPGGFE